MGLPDEPLLGALSTSPYWARNWLLFGCEVQPITGAVLILERGSGGHVGFAIGQDDTHFYVLGGNQSDAVTIARIAKSLLLGPMVKSSWSHPFRCNVAAPHPSLPANRPSNGPYGAEFSQLAPPPRRSVLSENSEIPA